MSEIEKLFDLIREHDLGSGIFLGWDEAQQMFIIQTADASQRYDIVMRLLERALEQFRSELPGQTDSIN